MKAVLVRALHAFMQSAAAVLFLTYQKFATGQSVSISTTGKLLIPAAVAGAAALYHGIPAVLGSVKAARLAKFEAAVAAAVAAQNAQAQVPPPVEPPVAAPVP